MLEIDCVESVRFDKNLLWVEVVWLHSGVPACGRTRPEAVHKGSPKAPHLQR